MFTDVNHQIVTTLAENELPAFGEDGLVSGYMKVFFYMLVYIYVLVFFPAPPAWVSDVETCSSVLFFLRRREEGMLFSTHPPGSPALLSDAKMVPVLHLACISNQKQLRLSIARFVECITNIAEQALDNFRLFSVSYLIGKAWVKYPSYYETMLFYIFHH